MKDVRPEFSPEEYNRLRFEADRLGISLKQLVHDRAVKAAPADNPLTAVQVLASEISKNREILNQIIKRETTAETKLYEDDIIRLEMAMTDLESIVTTFIAEILKKVN